ncbi:unnamed protein product [Nezara viridula]|uniref:Uncharacterized protein n=1 Tax=Nezara viridula TaxID=85310 RepID=A0A9P0MRM0_NEZVI|nr:unnamed protein product [Nezara viridula]
MSNKKGSEKRRYLWTPVAAGNGYDQSELINQAENPGHFLPAGRMGRKPNINLRSDCIAASMVARPSRSTNLMNDCDCGSELLEYFPVLRWVLRHGLAIEPCGDADGD